MNTAVKDVGPDDDARLMATFVESRDRRVFETLYQRHRNAVVAYAGRYVRNAARAEELAQEVFVRVYRTKRYEPNARFKTWLYRVATNVCLNEVRKAEHQQRIDSLDEEASGPREIASHDAGDPESRMRGQQLADRLQVVLQDLPEKQRAAFVMVRHEGLSHDEIADALGTSVPAVKSLVHRALKALRSEATALLAESPSAAMRPAT